MCKNISLGGERKILIRKSSEREIRKYSYIGLQSIFRLFSFQKTADIKRNKDVIVQLRLENVNLY